MIERGPYQVRFSGWGKWIVVDPNYPEGDSSIYRRGEFATQIEAINFATKLHDEDLACAESASAK